MLLWRLLLYTGTLQGKGSWQFGFKELASAILVFTSFTICTSILCSFDWIDLQFGGLVFQPFLFLLFQFFSKLTVWIINNQNCRGQKQHYCGTCPQWTKNGGLRFCLLLYSSTTILLPHCTFTITEILPSICPDTAFGGKLRHNPDLSLQHVWLWLTKIF